MCSISLNQRLQLWWVWPMPQKWAFISYSSKDDQVVSDIRQTLELLGIEIWADSQRLVGGGSLKRSIERAIEDATCFVAILSTDAINSAWVQKEIEHAVAVQRKRGDSYKIIPVLLPGSSQQP